MPEPEAPPEQKNPRLDSWKEIAAYLQRNVVTVQRWEKQEGLPVHRHPHQKRSSVYAYPSEIDQWRESRKAALPQVSSRRPFFNPSFALSFALTLALCLAMAGNGIRPQLAEADTPGEKHILVCSGPDCEQKKFSPDVESLLMNNGAYQVLADLRAKLSAGAPGGAVRWILSPDGARIAYTRTGLYSLPADQVSVINANGSGDRVLYRGGNVLAWSPDGSRLLIGSGEHFSSLVWVDLAGGRVHKLPLHWNLEKAMVSPDGRYIAFSAGKDRDSIENIFIMSSDGSSESILSASPAFQAPVGWMPDGKTLVYQQYSEPVTLWAATVANGKLQGLPVNLQTGFGKDAQILGISRRGALYYSVTAWHNDIYTASMDPATGKVNSTPAPLPVLNAGSNALPQWAPGSRSLLFQSGNSRLGEQAPHIYSFATGEERVVDWKPRDNAGSICWGRDGSTLLFRGPDNPWQIARFNLSNRRITPLFLAERGSEMESCAGDWIVDRVQTRLELRNVTGGASQTLHDAGPDSMAVGAVLSHDGRNVAFTTTGVRSPFASSPKAIRMISTAGGAARDLLTATGSQELQYLGMAWSPDDRYLYFIRRTDKHSPFELFRIPASGGQPESMGLKLDGLRQIDIAPDGSRIAFSVGSSGSELWAVEGFLPVKRGG